MKKNTISLIAAIILILGAIFLIQTSKTRVTDPTEVIELAKPSTSEENATPFQQSTSLRSLKKQALYPTAKELVGIAGYINSEEFKLEDYIGKKVILLDIWTYSCINCQRTLPFIKAWNEKYKDKGLLIVGVHSPEFAFEKKYENVANAVKKFNITYPVVLDNDFQTWRAYNNRYWPRKYLIDIDGFIVYDHIGEGGYGETEFKIQDLLEERNEVLQLKEISQKDAVTPKADNVDFKKIATPEIYFGHGFYRDHMGNEEGISPDEIVEYKAPQEINPNLFYLDGAWLNNRDGMKLVSAKGKIILHYFAKKVNIVAGSDTEEELTIYLDGEEHSKVKVADFDLYTILDEPTYGSHLLVIETSTPGFEIFTFTFG
jgi:thiol-disulfide isomerase/thioredoxin